MPLPLGQGQGDCRRLLRKEVFFFRGKHDKAAAAGIEPASGRLTAACPYQHGLHRKGGGSFQLIVFSIQSEVKRRALTEY